MINVSTSVLLLFAGNGRNLSVLKDEIYLTACILKQFLKMFSLSSSYGHRITQPTSARVEMEETKARLRTKRKVFVCKKIREEKNFLHILTSFLITPLKHSTNESNC